MRFRSREGGRGETLHHNNRAKNRDTANHKLHRGRDLDRSPPYPTDHYREYNPAARPPTRTYAKAATLTDRPQQATTGTSSKQTTTPKPKDIKGNGKAPTTDTKCKGNATSRMVQPAPPHVHPDRAALISANASPVSPSRTSYRPPPSQGPPPVSTAQSKAIVLHSAPTTYKPGQIRRWI